MVEFFFLILGTLIGGAFAWLWLEKKASEKAASPLLKKQEEYNVLMREKSEIQARLDLLKQQFEQNEVQIRDAFGKLSMDAIKSNNEVFMRYAEQTFDKYFQKAQTDFSHQQSIFSQTIDPLKKSLQKNEDLIKDVQEKNNQTFGNLQQYLAGLHADQEKLQKETGALVNALKSPKVRGRWGEIGLRRIVEYSGLSSFCDFDEQVQQQTDDGAMRPDMIIHLPENKNIVVDSKLPLAAYLGALETDDEAQKKHLMMQHSKALENHMKNLASKAYWQQFDGSIDFVVLYVEIESAFGAALLQNTSIVLDGIKNRVVFATPTTLITLLQTIAYTWKQHKATESVMEILAESNELYQRMITFSEYYEKIGQNINNLSKSYNQSIGSWEGRVLPSLKRMEEMGVKTGKKNIKLPEKSQEEIRLLKD